MGERFAYQGYETLHVVVDGEETGDQDISIFSGFSITFAITPGRVLKNLPTLPDVIDGYPISKIKTDTVMGSFGVPVGRSVTAQGSRVLDPGASALSMIPWDLDDLDFYVEFQKLGATEITPPVVMKIAERYPGASFNGLIELGNPLRLTGKESEVVPVSVRI